ncbi:hypothetical protein H0H87_002596 [Tephrocybe sp. NHM501043]|nr:hypothetical protein H0H87_002596 [Tephrocybe sp. NHM501043]
MPSRAPSKNVRFQDLPSTPHTYSPSISPSAFNNSGSVHTHSPLPYVAYRLNAVLSVSQRPTDRLWDIRLPESNAKLCHISGLSEPATEPPLPYMIITCASLPPNWAIRVEASHPKNGVTILDIAYAIYCDLRTPITEDEYQRDSSDMQRRISIAYQRRYQDVAKNEIDPMKRDKVGASLTAVFNVHHGRRPQQHTFMDYLLSPSPTASVSQPSRPRRPTREIPPLPPSAVPNDEPLIDLSSEGGHNTESTIHASAQNPPIFDEPKPTDLTSIRAHYLKKSLVQLQFRKEIDAITTHSPINNTSTLSFLGPPFSPPPKDAPFVDLPLLRYIFRQFVLTFPFMAAAPKDFYSEKLQPFVASALSRNLSPTSVLEDGDPDASGEQAARKKLLARVERNLALFVGAAIKLVENEQVVRLNQSDLDRLEALARKRMAKASKTKIVFEVNVIGVRTVVDKGRMRSRAHEARSLNLW